MGTAPALGRALPQTSCLLHTSARCQRSGRYHQQALTPDQAFDLAKQRLVEAMRPPEVEWWWLLAQIGGPGKAEQVAAAARLGIGRPLLFVETAAQGRHLALQAFRAE